MKIPWLLITYLRIKGKAIENKNEKKQFMVENNNFAPMTRKNIFFAAGCCLLFMAACQSPQDQIVRKWQVESVENPSEDSLIKVQEQSIDTITTLDSNMILYFGSTNVDSVKTAIKKTFKENVENSKKQQAEFIKQVTMEFRKDSTMVQTVMGKSDTAKWYMEKDKKSIVLAPLHPMAGMPDRKDVYQIEKLTSSQLRFKVSQNNIHTYINLKAASDEKKADEKKAEEKK